jgi:hypothetical protein
MNDDEGATMNGNRYYVARRGHEIRHRLWQRARYRHQLYYQQVDPLGDHPRYSGLAVRDLLRTVPLVAFRDVQPL